MSCTITSVSSGGGEDWIDLPIPADQIYEKVDAPGGSSWNINDLNAALDQVMTQVCSSINLLGYKEFKYGAVTNYGGTSLYATELTLTRNDIQNGIEKLITYYQAKPSTQSISVNAGIPITVGSAVILHPPFRIGLLNGVNNTYRLDAYCNLFVGSYNITTSGYTSVYSLKARN